MNEANQEADVKLKSFKERHAFLHMSRYLDLFRLCEITSYYMSHNGIPKRVIGF